MKFRVSVMPRNDVLGTGGASGVTGGGLSGGKGAFGAPAGCFGSS